MTTLLAVPEVDRSPPYQQIAAHYRERIRLGEIAVGTTLPPNRTMLTEWGVSTHTVQRAMKELKDAGIIETRPAKPPLVIAVPP